MQANVAIDRALPRRRRTAAEGAAVRHGHPLRPPVRRRPDRPPARAARQLRRQLRRDRPVRSRRARRALAPRNAIVIADELSGGTQEYGLGETVHRPDGEISGPANVHNRGGLTSVLFSRDGAAAPGAAEVGLVARGHPARDDAQPRRRAVGRAALDRAARPVATAVRPLLAGRATSCATPRTPAPAHPMQQDCAGAPRRDPAELRLRPRRLLQPGAGARLLPGDALEHLRLRLPRAVRRDRAGLRRRHGRARAFARRSPPAGRGWSASRRRGSVVKADGGRWQNGPIAYSFRWQRLRGHRWANIAGATRAKYRAKKADRGRRLRVQVVAANPDGRASAASPPTARVADRKIGHARLGCPAVSAALRTELVRLLPSAAVEELQRRLRREPGRCPRRTSAAARATSTGRLSRTGRERRRRHAAALRHAGRVRRENATPSAPPKSNRCEPPGPPSQSRDASGACRRRRP